MKNKELSNAVFWSRRQSNNAKSLTPGKVSYESHHQYIMLTYNHLPSRNIINASGIGGGGLIT
jgi:hypothetical protein